MIRFYFIIFLFLIFSSSVSANSCTPVNGGWSELSGCNEQCFQQRLCNNPVPSCGGANCSGVAIVSCTGGACSKCGDNYCSPKENNESCSADCAPTPTPSPTTTPTSTGSVTITPELPSNGFSSNSRNLFDSNPALIGITVGFCLVFGVLTTIIIWRVLKNSKNKISS